MLTKRISLTLGDSKFKINDQETFFSTHMPRRTTAIRILLSRITCLLVRKTWVRSGIHLKIDASTYNIHKMIFSQLSVSGTYFFRPKSCQILKKDLLHVQSWVIKKCLLFWQCDRTSEIISCPSGKFIHPRRLDGLSFQLWWCLFLVCLFVCVRISLLLLFFFSQCTRNREDDTRMGWTYSLLGCSDVKIL